MFLFPRRESFSEKGRAEVSGNVGCDSEELAEGAEENERLPMGVARRAGAQDLVPVVEWRKEQLDGGMKGDHGSSHILARGIEIKSARDLTALLEEIG